MSRRTPTQVLDDKRGAVRAAKPLRASVLIGKRRAAFAAESLSTTGARLVGPFALATHQRIDIVFELEDGPIRVAAEVVRVATKDLTEDQVAVRFVHVPTAARAAIHAFVARTMELTGTADDEDTETIRLPRVELEEEQATVRYPRKKRRSH